MKTQNVMQPLPLQTESKARKESPIVFRYAECSEPSTVGFLNKFPHCEKHQ